jgi:hypothetical protein
VLGSPVEALPNSLCVCVAGVLTNMTFLLPCPVLGMLPMLTVLFAPVRGFSLWLNLLRVHAD